MKIFVTGLCTLHWGRLQYGNIGNYYIIEPLFRELHRVFGEAEIITTFQMTEDFCKTEKVKVLPMEWYYSWQEHDLENAKIEYELAKNSDKKINDNFTPFMNTVLESSLLINVSGDMWGDNAEHVGKDRFEVDLYKMRTAQLLGVKTVLFAGTPGPFYTCKNIDFAKEVYSHFDLIINREPTSTQNLKKWNFESENVKDFACPAFLYTPDLTEMENDRVNQLIDKIRYQNKKMIGFTIGGFNLPVGPYDMWPREDWQYEIFAKTIEHIINNYDARVILISHTNGFELPPNFRLINGRDYPILKQLRDVVIERQRIKNQDDIILLDGPYLPKVTKSIIGKFDMMVTGRVHASVAAVSQNVPTVFINYEGSFIPSTKMYGFANLAGVGELVCEPKDLEKIEHTIDYCINNLSEIHERLEKNIPNIKAMARNAFDEMKLLCK